MIHSGVKIKESNFVLKNRPSLFPIRYELCPCKDGRFNMEALWAGRFVTPNRPIVTMCYWIGLEKEAIFIRILHLF